MDDSLSVINLTNIDSEDFEGMYLAEPYLIKSGETVQRPKILADHLAGQLVSKMLIREGKEWTSMTLRQPLLDRILGQIKVQVSETTPVVEQVVATPVAEPEFPEAPKEEAVEFIPEQPKVETKKRGRSRK